MDFTDRIQWQVANVLGGVEAMINSADMDIVEVEEQAASGARHDFGDKRGFGHILFREPEVGGRIFDQNLAPQRLLHMVDMVHHPPEHRPGRAGAANR